MVATSRAPQAPGLLPPGRGRRRRRRSGDLGRHLRLLRQLPDGGRRGAARQGHRRRLGVQQHDRDHGDHRGLGRRHRRRQPPRRGDPVGDRPADRRRRRRLLRGARGDEGHLRRHPHGLGVLRAGPRSARSSCSRAAGRGSSPRPTRRASRATRPTWTTSRGARSSSTTTTTRRRPSLGLSRTASQFVFYPRANGGFSVGTQGTDFFRGGDLVNGLTGVLHWSFPGFGADTWRIRPTAANPATFTVANPRPATPPAVGGAIKAVEHEPAQLLHDDRHDLEHQHRALRPERTLDCRGADSVAELNRQRERASIVICTLNADVYGFMELENTTPSGTITDLLGAVNARCGGAHPYAFVEHRRHARHRRHPRAS